MVDVDDRGLAADGLLIVVGGIGGLDWCGIAVRHVVKVARMPYSIQLFPWGHGFLRWHADLTNITNRDARAKLLAETIRQFKDRSSGWSGRPGCQIGRFGSRREGARIAR